MPTTQTLPLTTAMQVRRGISLALSILAIAASAVIVWVQITHPALSLSDGTFGLPEWQAVLVRSPAVWLLISLGALLLVAGRRQATTPGRRPFLILAVVALALSALGYYFPLLTGLFAIIPFFLALFAVS